MEAADEQMKGLLLSCVQVQGITVCSESDRGSKATMIEWGI
jgi:hypothetical protein